MSPFGLGTRVVVRVPNVGDMAVGEISQQHPDLWTIQLAEAVGEHEFGPGSRLVISAAVDGGLWVARSQLLRRSHATLVVSRPRLQNCKDRRRDHRVAALGTVGWSSRVGTGTAVAVDVSRSGLKLEVGDLLRVGDVAVLDVPGAARVSALVVALTEWNDGEADPDVVDLRRGEPQRTRYAHLAFLRADDETRAAIVAALAQPGEAPDGRREAITIDLRASELLFGVSA